ncbi:MAG: hypothetical protein KAR43_03765 [Deltaproteobacteria bacterium]|nr:hypothetical protein [Deltaproteobacteria bacterium]
MKKWILIICGVFVIITIILLIAGVSNLGPIIKKAVNTYGPGMTKTEVRIGDVGISIFSGEIKLKDFYLGNPGGFKSPQAMIVKSIYVDVDGGSLTGETIIIDTIEVVRPDIIYEKKGRTDNFKTILGNMNRAAGADKSPEQQREGKEDGKKLLIKNFIVRGGKVKLTISGLGDKSISASLPDIHLKDIGKEKGGAPPAEVFKEVFAAFYKDITSPAVTDNLNWELKESGLKVGTVRDDAEKELKEVTGKVKGLFGKKRR